MSVAHSFLTFLKLSPEHVYLHAGVRVGAKALGLPDWKDKLPMLATASVSRFDSERVLLMPLKFSPQDRAAAILIWPRAMANNSQ
jgi:hypothetical protein